MRKALIVNHLDAGGGAERFASTVVDGFSRLGTETWLAVGHRRTNHDRVVALPRPRRGIRAAAAHAIRRTAGLEEYDFPGSRGVLRVAGSPDPDVVIAINLHGGYFDLRELPELSRRVPVVLRLPDSWLFTGHCGTPLGCGRWEHGCGACPDLSIPPAVEQDATRVNWRRKRAALNSARLFVAPPSEWQLDRARRSLLGPAIESARVVHDGVDLTTFSPDGSAADRATLGVAPDAALLLFVGNLGAANRYKDADTLRAAVRALAARRPVELIVVGGAAPLERIDEASRIRHIPYVADRDRLAALYRAADLYVHAAWEETFCLTAAEALACGTPVVAAGMGGLAEVVDEGVTGHLVAPGDARGLAAAAARLLELPGERRRMGRRAAAVARERFDARRMVRELHAFCAELAS